MIQFKPSCISQLGDKEKLYNDYNYKHKIWCLKHTSMSLVPFSALVAWFPALAGAWGLRYPFL